MASTSLAPPLPSIDLVYAKTGTGRHEVLHRRAGLNARQRAVLIMIDGQRDARMLAAVMPAADVAPVLATLLALDLIVAQGPSVDSVLPVAPSPALETAALAAIKAELIATAETYLGLMAADVVARIRQARDATGLLRVLGQWHMAMQASKSGRDAAESVLEQTKAKLQGVQPA